MSQWSNRQSERATTDHALLSHIFDLFHRTRNLDLNSPHQESMDEKQIGLE
jgi:hypothetical protein